jgi:hypothetical protein
MHLVTLVSAKPQTVTSHRTPKRGSESLLWKVGTTLHQHIGQTTDSGQSVNHHVMSDISLGRDVCMLKITPTAALCNLGAWRIDTSGCANKYLRNIGAHHAILHLSSER